MSLQAASDLIRRMLVVQSERTGQDVDAIFAPHHHHDEHGDIVSDEAVDEEVSDG